MAADLERVIKLMHEHNIVCGIETAPPDGGIIARMSYGPHRQIASFHRTIIGERQTWPAGDITRWLMETASRFYPEDRFAERYFLELRYADKIEAAKRVVLLPSGSAKR
jgi:hypothetical protein